MQVSVIKPNKIANFFNAVNSGIKDNVPMDTVKKLWRDYSNKAFYHGGYQYHNMRRHDFLEAVLDDGTVVECDHEYYIAPTGGAYPSKGLDTRKGVKELPDNWKFIRVCKYRWGCSNYSIIARKNNDGTCTTFPMLDDTRW